MSRILVTGASGFIGRNVVPALRDAGYDVMEHSTSAGHIARCDLTSSRAEIVIHLAGRTFVPSSWEQTRDFYEVNLLGTVNVLEFCRRERASLLFVSSYVYGRPERLPISEDDPVAAVNPYAHTKLLAEDTCRFYQQQFDLSLTIIRLFNVYGPGQPEQFLIPSLVRQAISPECAEIVVADDRPRRDFVYVEDLVDVLTRMVSNPHPGIYNVGSGTSHSVGEVAAIINSLLAVPKPVRNNADRRTQEVPEVVADICRARSTFGWAPRVGLREGISRMLRASGAGQSHPGGTEIDVCVRDRSRQV
jgi:nucleoside-diphosphate-sugar epimerase